ncbi:MAG: erythromycin esterase family protein [Leptospiraceae bacterium]|nr:erythromycin esterase family protein [Leptospiraceae bacterium]
MNKINLADWIKNHFIHLNSVSQNNNFDDLIQLRDIIGNAKVIALGENSHFIKEFCELRHRIIRFLIEQCDFKVHAMEFGFAEGIALNHWIQDHSEPESKLKNLLNHFPYPLQIHETLKWIKKHNLSSKASVHFVGIDVPRNGGSLFPTLDILNEFFKLADPEASIYLSDIYRIAQNIDGFSTAQSAFFLNQISEEDKNLLTAQINRLLYRLEALAPRHISQYGKGQYNTILQHIKSLCYLDYNSHAMNRLISGNGLSGDMGARDKFMADSVLRRLKETNSKIVLVAHNAHIQKLPISYGDFLSCLPMGQRLADELGDDYIALGITSEGGHTAALYPDEKGKFGFRIENTKLDIPKEGSIEKLLADAQMHNGILGFKNIPRGSNDPKQIRFDSDYIETSVFDAFDGIIQIPISSVADEIII